MTGMNGKKDAIIIHDVFSKFNNCFPVTYKSAHEAMLAICTFRGDRDIRRIYCDNSGELIEAVKMLGIPRHPSIPGIPSSNARAERCNRDVLDGTRSILIAAGLPGCFWTFAAPTYCHLDNINVNSEGDIPWIKTHGSDFEGLRIPFGCEVVYRPAQTNKSGDLHKCGPTGRTGIFAGYQLGPGGEWSGGYLVWDLTEFEGVSLLSEARVMSNSLKLPLHSCTTLKYAPNFLFNAYCSTLAPLSLYLFGCYKYLLDGYYKN